MLTNWIYDLMGDLAKSQPDKEAIVFYKTKGKTKTLTFAQLKETVEAYAERNRKIGIKQGDRVAMVVPLSLSAYLNILSLGYMGATFVPISEKLDEGELSRTIRDADPSCVIATEEIYREKLSGVDVLVVEDGLEGRALNDKSYTETKDSDIEVMAILYSSGTTSVSKGVVIGYEEELNAFKNFDEVVPHNMDRFLALYPIYHIGGVTSFLVCLLWRKMTVATMEETSAVQLTHVFEQYRPNLFIMVPGVINAIKGKIEHKLGGLAFLVNFCGWVRRKTGLNPGRHLLSTINEQAFGGELKVIASGGGMIDPESIRFFYNAGFDACDLYASTEGNAPLIINRGYRYFRGGFVEDFYPNIEYRIDNPDEKGVGEVLVKSNSIMKGYFRSPELTKAAFVDGYFKTGDLGRIDEGYLRILGRIKDSVFLPNGEKISIEDAENAIRARLSDVSFALAPVKTEDGTCDELHLCVVGKNGEYDELLSEVNNSISADFRFREVHYVDELPLTAIGKVKRFMLTDMINAKEDAPESYDSGDATDLPELKKLTKKRDLITIVSEFTKVKEVSLEHRFSEDLGMESLSMFKLFIELEKEYGMEMPRTLTRIRTVGDLDGFINGSLNLNLFRKDYTKYPVTRTSKLKAKLIDKVDKLIASGKLLVEGIENVPGDTNMIISSNHTSLYDPLWILAALGRDYVRHQKYTALANRIWRKFFIFKAVGGIPVPPFGDRMGTLYRAQMCLSEGYDLIIFPEAHLHSRVAAFQQGVAMLAERSGLPVLPMHIKKIKGIITVQIGKLLNMDPGETLSAFTERLRDTVISLSHKTSPAEAKSN